MSIGRRPVIEGYGLDKIGVETERGHIKEMKSVKPTYPSLCCR